ncbi:MAG: recombinase family protein [Planctomycetota bacterium]
MNVVIWARVSSREQKEGYSIDAQLRANRERALKNGWSVLREFVVAESAKRGAERTAFNEMFRWVKANARREKIKAILAHKLDRVCRNMRDAVRLQELEDDCSVQLAFVENQFGPGAAGALSFNVMAAVSQYYSDNLRTEVLKGMDERVRQGWPSGLAPYGYLNVSDRNAPVQPHPEESKTLIRIFQLYATGKYTFDMLADKLAEEGRIYVPSQPRFYRTTLSHILNNRFYAGELHRGGNVYQGKYRLIVDRTTFEACQEVLSGKSRRVLRHEHLFSGGLIRCAHCGFAMTSEHINRKLKAGGVREHVYYRCGNIHVGKMHPQIRWREDKLEEIIIKELEAFKMPPHIAEWFRTSIEASFADVDAVQRHSKQTLTKRKSELEGMLDRLLSGFIAGHVEESVFTAKTASLKREAAEVEESLAQAKKYDPEAPVRALALFDFSQNLVDLWRGSNSEVKREILDAISLNRTLSHASLELAKRCPFDFLAKHAEFKNGRSDRI